MPGKKLKMENLPHTKEGLILATYKMAVNNNALLKLLLFNQQALMAKLNVDSPNYNVFYEGDTSEDSLESQIVSEKMKLSLRLVQELESLSSKQAWDFAVENDSNLDFDKDNL